MNALRKMESIITPLVVVVGATGCGKSKLALELAQKYNGEVISADAMQVYEGLDITTNKVTKDEQQGIPHHLLNCINPLKRFTVTDFATRALPVIDHLISHGKMPVVVGGTNYYIESLLWKVLISEESGDDTLVLDKDTEKLQSHTAESKEYYRNNSNELRENVSKLSFKNTAFVQVDKNYDSCDVDDILKMYIAPDTMTQIPSHILHEALKKVDPKMANSLHPNEKRKVIRSLQIYQQQKRTQSEILEEQRSLSGGCSLGGPLRYKNAVVFWLQCNQKELEERLDSRVDCMIEQDLIKEMLTFHAEYNAYRLSVNKLPDYTQGIFQSIGFKEFHEYLILSEEQRNSEHGKKLFAEGLESMKLVTRRYSRKQIKWIKNRFLRKDREAPPVYALDATDLSQWQENVLNLATHVMDALLNGCLSKIIPLPAEKDCVNIRKSFYCEECEKTMIGTVVWEKHLKSRKHQKMKKRRHAALQNLAATLEKFEDHLKANTETSPIA